MGWEDAVGKGRRRDEGLRCMIGGVGFSSPYTIISEQSGFVEEYKTYTFTEDNPLVADYTEGSKGVS